MRIIWKIFGSGEIDWDERRYLRTFEKAQCSSKTRRSGYLDCRKAGKESHVDYERGYLANRLSERGLLKQKRWGEPDFVITSKGIHALHPWRERKIYILITVLAVVLTVVLSRISCAPKELISSHWDRIVPSGVPTVPIEDNADSSE